MTEVLAQFAITRNSLRRNPRARRATSGRLLIPTRPTARIIHTFDLPEFFRTASMAEFQHAADLGKFNIEVDLDDFSAHVNEEVLAYALRTMPAAAAHFQFLMRQCVVNEFTATAQHRAERFVTLCNFWANDKPDLDISMAAMIVYCLVQHGMIGSGLTVFLVAFQHAVERLPRSTGVWTWPHMVMWPPSMSAYTALRAETFRLFINTTAPTKSNYAADVAELDAFATYYEIEFINRLRRLALPTTV